MKDGTLIWIPESAKKMKTEIMVAAHFSNGRH